MILGYMYDMILHAKSNVFPSTFEAQYRKMHHFILCLHRWRLVIHGAIDGYSRLIVFLCWSNNNRAETVLQLFLKAVSEFGLPSRLRIDKGGENVDVALYMLGASFEGRWPRECDSRKQYPQSTDRKTMERRIQWGLMLVSISVLSS